MRIILLFLPFLEEFPYVRGNPELSTLYNETTGDFFFLCEFLEESRPGVSFFVEWQHNSQTVTKINVTELGENSTIVTLNALDIQFFQYQSQVSVNENFR